MASEKQDSVLSSGVQLETQSQLALMVCSSLSLRKVVEGFDFSVCSLTEELGDDFFWPAEPAWVLP